MLKTVQYLEEKNMYLEKFLGLNREWLDRLTRGNFDEIEVFRETRENILNIIKHIDALIEAHSEDIDADQVESVAKAKINGLLDRKDALVKVILSQDLEIMELIEAAKTQIIQELQQVAKGRKTIGSYKSSPNRRKDTIDEEI